MVNNSQMLCVADPQHITDWPLRSHVNTPNLPPVNFWHSKLSRHFLSLLLILGAHLLFLGLKWQRDMRSWHVITNCHTVNTWHSWHDGHTRVSQRKTVILTFPTVKINIEYVSAPSVQDITSLLCQIHISISMTRAWTLSKHVLDSWLLSVANSKNKYINTLDTFAKYLF